MEAPQTTPEIASEAPPSIPQKLLVSNIPDGFLFQAFWLAVRLAVGGLMIHNGLDKIADVQGLADNAVSAYLGLSSPIVFTYCAAYIEIISSVCIMFGLLTRFHATVILATMGFAIFFHIKADGLAIPPLETAWLYAILYTCFLVNGSGKWSLDEIMVKKLAENRLREDV